MQRKLWLLLAAMSTVAFAAPSPSAAQEPALVTTVASTFIPGDDQMALDLVIRQGQPLNLRNVDFAAHNVTSDLTVDGFPIFRSGSISIIDRDQPVPVNGVENLAIGEYGFYCSIHSSMRGTLSVQ